MDRFSIPNLDAHVGNESLADTFTPTGTRIMPRIDAVVLPRAGTGVSLVERESKRHRTTAIAASVASLTCIATLLALYAM